MGTRKWDGLPLYSGYATHIGGKEVETDSPITRAEMPAISGKSLEFENEMEYDKPSEAQDDDTFVPQVRSSAPSTPAARSPAVTNAPSASKPYVSSSSFYAHVAAKPKPAGPL